MAFSVPFLSTLPILDLLIEPLRVFVVPYVVFFVVAELLFPRREAALTRVAAAATRRLGAWRREGRVPGGVHWGSSVVLGSDVCSSS